MPGNRLVALHVALLLVLGTACRTIPMTPEQSAGLKEAQRFADEVTDTYRARRVTIMVYESHFSPSLSWGRYLMFPAADLDRGNVRERIVHLLAVATLDPPPAAPTAVEYRRQYLFDVTRRAVEIYVRSLEVAPREAIQGAGGIVGRLHDSFRLPRDYFGEVHPCDLRRDLWSHFAIPDDPTDTCKAGLMSK